MTRQSMIVFIISLTLSCIQLSYAEDSKTCRCQPDQPCWPDKTVWKEFRGKLSGRLIQPSIVLESCYKDANSKDCTKTLKNIHNPFYNENISGGTQSQGWMDAWNSQPSVYAVEATDAHDVATAVNFAREHNLRVVIKGTGHDYLGRSNAPNSLLIWTHRMRTITYDEAFVPEGCSIKGVPALTIGAGTRWLEAYDAATNQHNRYVQGGGCTTVGAAGGFIQGGGFGSFSKKYGTGAMGILQVEIVTADGKTLIANQCQNKDLYWAVRGGGGGTFGVVTKMTLKTYKLPVNFGILRGTIKAANDDAFKKLIREFITFYRGNLSNEHWGEQVRFNPDNTITLNLLFHDISETMAKYTLAPLRAWMNQQQGLYSIDDSVIVIPADKLWNEEYMTKNHPEFITHNPEKGAPKSQFWWTPNSGEVSRYWYAYQSWWLPISLFADENAGKLADAIYQSSRVTATTLHFNKGLSGAPQDVITEGRKTATHPSAFDSAALVIINAGNNQVYPGVKGKEPDMEKAKVEAEKAKQAISYFINAAPLAGTYVNEADYFIPNWQQAFWGDNYSKLLEIKKKYDPNGLFYCHHCVGSEAWSADGMCKK